MIPPLIPLSAAPVTAQQDPVRATPPIPPVTPAQPASDESQIDLRNQERDEAAAYLREEQRRRQAQDRRRQQGDEDEDEEGRALVVPGHELNADNTVPAVALIDEAPRQGLWVDIKI